MIKLILLLLTFFYFITANASSEKIDLEIKLIDDKYKINVACGFIGEKSIKVYLFQFKSNDFISRQVDDLKTHITIKSDYGDIDLPTAGIMDSILSLSIDEKNLIKLFNNSKTLTVNLNPYLIEEEVLRNKYLLKLFIRGLDSNNTNVNSGVGVYEAANPHITVNIKKEELGQHLEKCNKQQKQWLSERKGEIQKLTQSAKNGDLEAQTDLAMHYYEGGWVLKDINKTMKWLKIAAKNGHPRAQYNLGIMYTIDDLDQIHDLKKAKKWIGKAHENGHPQAQKMWNHYELWKY